MKPSDLATYLFYDHEAHYLRSDGASYARSAALDSESLSTEAGDATGAEWVLEVSESDPERFRLAHLDSGLFVGVEWLVADAGEAAEVSLFPSVDCALFFELSLDAEGAVGRTGFDDGSLFGIVDTHSHILTNAAFGGGGIFHGAPFHPLGVAHALPDCLANHGSEGRRDLLGFGFDHVGRTDADETLFLSLITGRAPGFNHHTDGYPTFSGWPSAHFSSTHQTQYYQWLKRAYLGGLRLVVQHATSKQILCELMDGIGNQNARYSCNDMVAIDVILEQTYAAPGPRFGPNSVCDEPHKDPLTYPFESFAGDVTFREPRVGERAIEFNTEGIAHIGLLPELIEDARQDGVTDEDLEYLVKSAEGYLRMCWELAKARAGAAAAR